jgi:hypothetical protein
MLRKEAIGKPSNNGNVFFIAMYQAIMAFTWRTIWHLAEKQSFICIPDLYI